MDFVRIIKYSAFHILSIVASFCFVGVLFGGFKHSFHAMDIMFVIFFSILLSLPIYIYLAYGAEKKPYLVSFITLICVLVVVQIIGYTLNTNIMFYGVFLIPLAFLSQLIQTKRALPTI